MAETAELSMHRMMNKDTHELEYVLEVRYQYDRGEEIGNCIHYCDHCSLFIDDPMVTDDDDPFDYRCPRCLTGTTIYSPYIEIARATTLVRLVQELQNYAPQIIKEIEKDPANRIFLMV